MKKLDLEPILERIAGGEPVPEIARSVGLSGDGLRSNLRRNAPKEYRSALELALAGRLMEADDALDNARSPRELINAARLGRSIRYLARRRPRKLSTLLKKLTP